MRIFVFVIPIALLACSDTRGPPEPVDLNAAADQAAKTVAGYAAGTSQPAAALDGSATPSPISSVSAGDDAVAAASLVKNYHRLIAMHRYDAARASWTDPDRPADLSPQAFAAGFSDYATYVATVDTAGPVDAGAGQRHVTVPVHVAGTLQDDTPFARVGSMTLHRAADGIESDDPNAHRWRIARSDMKPATIAAIPQP